MPVTPIVKKSPEIDAVVFDVGETLVNETSEYGAWADWLGIPRHTFSAVFGAVIASGRDHRDVFRYFRSGFDLDAERSRRDMAGVPDGFGPVDLYPDARPAMAALRDAGYLVVLAANQPQRAHRILEALDLPVDLVTTSAALGVAKPDPAFFTHIISVCADLGFPDITPERICYVGDRLDNDIVPAKRAGMRAAFVRRGPWGYLFADHPDTAEAEYHLDHLTDLPALLAADGAR